MAPARTPGRKTREMDYSDIGKQGRKTGITVKDTGVRDENGLEPIDGLYSSPEKSTRRPNGVNHNTTISSEEDMDIGESTIPEPTDVLSGRRNGRPILPPPHSRSPVKTSLNTPARRSVGPMSSPLRPVNNTSTRAASHPTVKRRLDFSTEELKPSIERSPQRERQLRASNRSQPLSAGSRLSGGSSSASQPSSKQGKRKVFDLGAHDDDGDDENDEESATFEDEVHQLNGVAEVDDINGTAEESMQIMYDEDDDQHPFDVDYESPSLVRSPKSKRGRPRKNVSGGSEVLPVTAPITKKRGGRKSDLAPVDADSSQVSIEAKPRRGRRPKNPETAAPLEVEEDENEGERPAKRARNTKVDGAPVDIAPQDTRPPPAKRGPKAKVTSATATKAKADVVEPEVPQRSNGRPKPRSLYVMRSGTPAEDDGSRTTRSGRTSVKPLAYWRNERIVYGEDEGKAGERYLLPTIKEVIRTEEVVEPRPKRAKGRPRMAGRKRQLEELEEEDEEQEPWETEEGVKRGPVRAWNPVQGSDVEDEEEESELAYAQAAIETREVHNSTFRYAKIVTFPFFGSGMVDLPPNGQKKKKNSRTMQMVFFVFYGRVTVEVGDNMFSIGKGGMWQVPRGNFYGITNHSEHPARIFFAQGCEELLDPAANDTQLLYGTGPSHGA